MEKEEMDVLDILLDEENDDPISLFDENDNEIKFEQVAIIPENEKIYAILKPIDEMEGVEDDEAIVFVVDQDEEGNSVLIVEKDEPTAIKVFDKYYQLLDEAEEESKKENK
ncbi:MAG: DUF1292 domain-containing protein [Christensenellales bacterium]